MFGFERVGKGPSEDDKKALSALLAGSPENITQAITPEHFNDAQKLLSLPGVTAEIISKRLSQLVEEQKISDSEDIRKALTLLRNSIQ